MIQQTFSHLIYIPVTSVGIKDKYRTPDWLPYRLSIFKNYTLKSLLNQTNKKFTIWLSFRPEDFANPLIEGLEEYLKTKKVACIMTFDGLMYWDDKFSGNLWQILKNILRIIRFCIRTKSKKDLRSQFIGVFVNKNKTLPRRLSNTLGILKTIIKKCDWVYVTRIDSDDMFDKNVVKEIHLMPPFEGAYIYDKGYVYNKNTKVLCEWLPKTIPPFYTIIFKPEVFFDAKKYLEYYGKWRSHEDTEKVFQCRKLQDGKYCVLVHNQAQQISTIWNHPFRGEEVNKSILGNFGVNE